MTTVAACPTCGTEPCEGARFCDGCGAPVTEMAAARGVDVFTADCESHATDVPFYVVSRMLRVATGVRGLDGPAARLRVRAH